MPPIRFLFVEISIPLKRQASQPEYISPYKHKDFMLSEKIGNLNLDLLCLVFSLSP